MGLCQSRNSNLPEKYQWIDSVEKNYDIDSHIFECAECGKNFIMESNKGNSYCTNGRLTYHRLKEDDNVFYAIVKSKHKKKKS